MNRPLCPNQPALVSASSIAVPGQTASPSTPHCFAGHGVALLFVMTMALSGQAASALAGSATVPPTDLASTIWPPRQPPNQFYNPNAMAVGPQGFVYVVDHDNHRVQYYDPSGAYLGQWGSFGREEGRFVNINALALAADGTVRVWDQYSFADGPPPARAQIFDAHGTYRGQMVDLTFGVFAPDGTVFSLAATAPRVRHYDSSGKLMGAWGQDGSGDGQFGRFMALDIGIDGSIYIADMSNYRIQVFSPGGRFLRKWGMRGTGTGEFGTDRLLIAVGTEQMVVIERGPDGGLVRAQRFGLQGEYLGDTVSDDDASRQTITQADMGPGDTLYVLFPVIARIARYANNGAKLSSWGQVIEHNALAGGTGIAVAPDGALVLSDGAHLVRLGPLGDVRSDLDLGIALAGQTGDQELLARCRGRIRQHLLSHRAGRSFPARCDP